MLIADMIHSCSNDKVAQAAVASIGGRFAERVHDAAARSGVNAGRFVSLVVRNFARRADEQTLTVLSGQMAGSDQPLLRGLVRVVEQSLDDGNASVVDFDDDDDVRQFGSVIRCAGSTLRLQ